MCGVVLWRRCASRSVGRGVFVAGVVGRYYHGHSGRYTVPGTFVKGAQERGYEMEDSSYDSDGVVCLPFRLRFDP